MSRRSDALHALLGTGKLTCMRPRMPPYFSLRPYVIASTNAGHLVQVAYSRRLSQATLSWNLPHSASPAEAGTRVYGRARLLTVAASTLRKAALNPFPARSAQLQILSLSLAGGSSSAHLHAAHRS